MGRQARSETGPMPQAWPLAALELLAPLAPWFETGRRDLPWRATDLDGPHPDPYAVLVSELMLQQTQVATVVPYFERWMARFPTPAALAAASEDDVHKAWEGLGYYRRARFLQATARRIAEQGWPGDLAGLLALPGLGPYTAAAVASIAFQWPEPALDGNAFRVLARLLGLEGDPKDRAGELRTWLRPALAALGPSRLTQALMELGATVCTPAARCAGCPLSGVCRAQALGLQERIPPVQARAKVTTTALWLVAIQADGRWLLQPPRKGGLLSGLWTWPTVPRPDDTGETAPSGGPATSWPSWTQVYTHRREHVSPLLMGGGAPPNLPGTWVNEARLAQLPMGKRDSRLRELLGTRGQSAPVPAEVHAWLADLRRGAGPGT